MMAKTLRAVWRAGADRTLHAHLAGRPRTLCDVPVVPEYLAWTDAFRKCPKCLEQLAAAPALGL